MNNHNVDGAARREWAAAIAARWRPYLLAVCLVIATVAVRLAIAPLLGDRSVPVLFVIPVIVSAYMGGLGPGLLSTGMVAAGTAYFVIPPRYSFAIERSADVVQWLILCLICVLISILIEDLRGARRRLDAPALQMRSSGTENTIRIGFAVALASLGLIGIVSYVNITTLHSDAAWFGRTRDVIVGLESLYSRTMDAQNYSISFSSDLDERYQQQFTQAGQQATAQLQQLLSKTSDNPVQQQRLQPLVSLLQRQLAFDQQLIRIRREQGLDAARGHFRSGVGDKLHNQIRIRIDDAKAEAQQQLAIRERKAQRTSKVAQVIILGGGLFAFANIGLALLIIRRDFAARLHAEQALLTSEENLAVTLHSIGDGVIATDTRGRITRINQVAENLTGWSQREAAGRAVAEVLVIINEITRQPAPIPVENVLATGVIHGLANHTILIARDGSERAIADSAAPIRDQLGRILGVVMVFRDVSEAQRLQRIETQYAAMVASSHDAILSKTLDGTITSCNPAAERLFGYAANEIIGQSMTLLLSADRIEEERQILSRIASDGGFEQFETRRVCRDGRSLDVAATISPIKDGNNRIIGAASIIRDITEHRAMQDALRNANAVLEQRVQQRTLELKQANDAISNSERRFRALVEHGADGVVVVDVNDTILYLSPAVAAIEGYTEAELAGKNVAENAHPDDLPTLQTAMQQVLAKPGTPITVLSRRRHKHGHWVWLEGFLTNMLHDPAVGGIVANYRDVTERVTAAEQIRRLNESLELRVKQRTAELEAANKELESFSYSVSHDLRAPLRHIQGYADMLQHETKSEFSENGLRYLQTIKSATREMSQLIDDLLAFSRMGRAELRETAVQMDDLVEEVRRKLMLVNPERQINWTIAALPMVTGDAALLKQVFVNLLDNAIKYTRLRTPAQIDIGAAGEQDGQVVLYVRDNGAGFDMRYADKLFGIFQRLHHVHEFEGTGIGLANVRRIIARHGGRTWAEAKPDAGATFYFTLPRAPN